MLKVKTPNVYKTLARYDVPHQTLRVGRREMRVFLRSDIERVRRDLERKARARDAKAAT